jgi:murein DD-endopeptidase MepM/ murein hydrolase activator NlpD
MILFALGAAVMLPACSSVPVVDTGKRGIFQQAGPGDNMTSPRSLPIALTPATSERSESGFVWPVREGRISSFFGKRRRDFHEGVDIRSSRGAPVYAAQDGQVIYSSRRIGGYGNMVVVRHAGDMATVYAHNKKNLVKVGDHVTQGAVIALVGATGKATGPHLHFEIRKGELPQDPLLYLPEIRSPAVAKK